MEIEQVTTVSELDDTIAALGLGDGAESCRWTPDDDDDVYDTGCGGRFWIQSGTPTSNQMIFCCYCGKRIEEEKQ